MSKRPKFTMEEERPLTTGRKVWVVITWSQTWLIPNFLIAFFLGFKNSNGLARAIMAWREKVTLCMIALWACAAVTAFVFGLSYLVCPPSTVRSTFEVSRMVDTDDPYVIIYGGYYSIKDLFQSHVRFESDDSSTFNEFKDVLGKDVSEMFFPARSWSTACANIPDPGASWDNFIHRDQIYHPHSDNAKDYLAAVRSKKKGLVGHPTEFLTGNNDPLRNIIMIRDQLYDVSSYVQSTKDFFDPNVRTVFANWTGKDATSVWRQLERHDPIYYRRVLNCMDNLFFIGVVDHRNDFKCQLTNWIILCVSIAVLLTVAVKFIFGQFNGRSAQSPNSSTSEKHVDLNSKYVMIQVPCYTEDRDTLEATFRSIAKTDFDYKQKLLVVICDGYATGKGQGKPTPEIAKEILFGGEEEASAAGDPPPLVYQAVATGRKAINRAQVYNGIYQHQGHKLQFMLIVKVGNEDELVNDDPKRGNRKKRDSQIVLMRFLNKIYRGAVSLTELEYEMYRVMTEIVQVHPTTYEFMLMLHADTRVEPDSILKMVTRMTSDAEILGLCGETKVQDDRTNWVTIVQVYEYYIAHYLHKAFESVAGTVTCLPGCFSMYRIRASGSKPTPLIVCTNIVGAYAEPREDTVHMKNLLSLGEDRYLTTLGLKYAPNGYKTKFTADALCTTNVPHNFADLLSKRRRWINSTVHNSTELMRSTGCFSVRSVVVLLDLFGTFIGPMGLIYLAYLALDAIFMQGTVPIFSLGIFACVYALQLIPFVFKLDWSLLVYTVVYVFAMVIFQLVLPIYSFWKMDDFSWMDTGEDDDDISFDFSIPVKSLKDWELEKDMLSDGYSDSENHQQHETSETDYPYAPWRPSCPMSRSLEPNVEVRLLRERFEAVSLYGSHVSEPPRPGRRPSYEGHDMKPLGKPNDH